MSRNLTLGRVLLQRCLRPFQPVVSQFCTRQISKEDMDKLLKNPFYTKYADKFQHLKESNPEAFLAKLEELEKAYEKTKANAKADKEAQSATAATAGQTKPKSLDSILKTDLIKDKSREEIETIWMEYHRDKDSLFAVIPTPEYDDLRKRLQDFPTFVYPVPRGQGYVFYYQQFYYDCLHFTPLLMYQTHKENAPICLTLEHYTELKEDKGLVLMRGQPDTKVISVNEAQLLALQVKMYYGMNSALKFNLVRLFNNSPASFDHMALVREFEQYKKDSTFAKEERKQ